MSHFNVTRRKFMGGVLGGAAMLAVKSAWAAGKTLNVLSHKVHQTVLGSGDGELMADWRSDNDADIIWTTFDSNPLQDRLFREASLDSTSFNVGYLIDNRPTSQIAALFEPLDDYLKNDAIEDFGDIAPGLVQGMTVDGKLIGVPVRHATQGLFYNEELLEEQGISAPPTTLEELAEQVEKLTFTSKAGTKVAGMVLASDLAVFPVMFARAYGGDFLTKNFELLPDPSAMEKALGLLRKMFEAGGLPRSYATTKNDDQVTWLQQGRAGLHRAALRAQCPVE
ncbi:MAG: ABC transporter substrate-binding protein [Phyllobacterium sp.]